MVGQGFSTPIIWDQFVASRMAVEQEQAVTGSPHAVEIVAQWSPLLRREGHLSKLFNLRAVAQSISDAGTATYDFIHSFGTRSMIQIHSPRPFP